MSPTATSHCIDDGKTRVVAERAREEIAVGEMLSGAAHALVAIAEALEDLAACGPKTEYRFDPIPSAIREVEPT